MTHPTKKTFLSALGAGPTAGVCFALICLTLGGLAVLVPRGETEAMGLSRGFVPFVLWAGHAGRPEAEPARCQTRQPTVGGQAAPAVPPAVRMPAVPAATPVVPKAVHFFR